MLKKTKTLRAFKPGLPKFLRILFLMAAVMVLAVLAIACKSDKVLIATDGEYHPFNFVNEDTGEIGGLERELGDELCRRAGLECKWTINAWEDMIPDLRTDQFDAIMAGMSITSARDELIDFTEPYYPPTPSVYIARAGEGDDAIQGTLGAMEETIHSNYFQATDRQYVGFEDPEGSLDALLSGEIDAILVDRPYALEKLAEHEGRVAIVGPGVPLDQGFGIGIREDSPLRERFNEAIASMKADGTLNDLLRKWVGEGSDTF